MHLRHNYKRFKGWYDVDADLGGVDLPLDDVEDGDVAVLDLLVDGGGDHHVLGLQQWFMFRFILHSRVSSGHGYDRSASSKIETGSKFLTMVMNDHGQ